MSIFGFCCALVGIVFEVVDVWAVELVRVGCGVVVNVVFTEVFFKICVCAIVSECIVFVCVDVIGVGGCLVLIDVHVIMVFGEVWIVFVRIGLNSIDVAVVGAVWICGTVINVFVFGWNHCVVGWVGGVFLDVYCIVMVTQFGCVV